MAGLCPGNILTTDGTTVSGSDLCLSPNQISQLQSAYNSAVSAGQSSSQAFKTASSQVYTASGNTLADALQLFQTAINIHGGPANSNLSTSSIISGYVNSAISPQTLSNILTGSTSGSSTSRYGSGSTTSELNLSSSSVLIPLVVVGFPILLMLFFSSTNLPTKHVAYYTNPNQTRM